MVQQLEQAEGDRVGSVELALDRVELRKLECMIGVVDTTSSFMGSCQTMSLGTARC